MAVANDALMAAHRNNIHRYRRLLQTRLTDIERSYLRTRLAEEVSALRSMFEQCSQIAGDGGAMDELKVR